MDVFSITSVKLGCMMFWCEGDEQSMTLFCIIITYNWEHFDGIIKMHTICLRQKRC